MDKISKTFNDLALEQVCRAMDYLENDRILEAHTIMKTLRAELLISINKERREAKQCR